LGSRGHGSGTNHSPFCRCSLDGEWATETRHNGGPGKKKGRMAVVSICYLAPDTPTGLSTAFDLLPWCRVGVFQVFDLAQLPISLKDLIETKSVVKTGKVCISLYRFLTYHLCANYSLSLLFCKNIQSCDGKYLKEDWNAELTNWEV
jgi:hypothetical protein